MTLHIRLSTSNILVVEGENIKKFYKQFATGADFIPVTALDLEIWTYNKKLTTIDLEDLVYNKYKVEPSLHIINTKHIVMFNEEND